MGSAARRRGAYGGEYLRAGLRLCARGGRRKAKDLVKLGQENTTKGRDNAGWNNFSVFRSSPKQRSVVPFYSWSIACLGVRDKFQILWQARNGQTWSLSIHRIDLVAIQLPVSCDDRTSGRAKAGLQAPASQWLGSGLLAPAWAKGPPARGSVGATITQRCWARDRSLASSPFFLFLLLFLLSF
jgi:hypothetical protein